MRLSAGFCLFAFVLLVEISGVFSASRFFPATNPAIGYMGRILRDEAQRQVLLDWPCVTIHATFQASSIAISLDGGNNDFIVYLDNRELPRIQTRDSSKVFLIANNLEESVAHNLTIHKITEASFFIFEPLLPLSRVIFHGFYLTGNNATLFRSSSLTKQPRRRIEVFGDSDSNGFGIEGPDDLDCMLSLTAYENCYAGYATQIAAAVDADLSIEAWSGKGVVKNAVDFYSESSNPMPVYWNRTLATVPGAMWDFTHYTPDLVIILLGTNDYYSWPYPSDEEFQDGYLKMLKSIVSSYSFLPSSQRPVLLNLCGGTMDNDRAPCANVKSVSEVFASTVYPSTHFVEIGQDWLSYPEDYGCLDHRNLKGQRILASKLLPYVKTIMNW